MTALTASIGAVDTRFFTVEEPFRLHSGEVLQPIGFGTEKVEERFRRRPVR